MRLQDVQEAGDFAEAGQSRTSFLIDSPGDRNPLMLAHGANGGEGFPGTGQHRQVGPVESRMQLLHPLPFPDKCCGLLCATGHGEHLNPSLNKGIEFGPASAGRILGAQVVPADGVIRFHAVPVVGDEGVGGGDDVAGRAIVFHEMMDFGGVVFAKPLNECHIGAAPGVDVLVVVADGQDGELAVRVAVGSPRQCRNEVVLGFIDVLIFIDQDVTKS